MSQANLSETLFKPRFKHPETSTLVRRFSAGKPQAMQSALSGNHVDHWYRLINRLMWIWRGVTPQEILDVQARIVMSEAERTDPELFDTVIGYRGGNWIFEWAKEAMQWQQKAGQEADPLLSGRHWLHASNLYSIAAYPHIKGDELAEQAQALANRAYEEAAQRLPGSLHALRHLENVPWIDHTRVAAFGFRFGANIAVRLGYLEPQRLKAVACLGPVVHGLLVDPLHQGRVPEMYLDVLASRLGMHDASDEALRVELNRYSLKTQGLLGRRCPTPMLSGFWKDDPFSPEEESRLITSSSADGKLLEIPFNPVYRNFDHALRQIARWINHRFG